MSTRNIIDHLGREIKAPEVPQRIISLCPSLTATLYDLGLGERIVGITHFCIHPADKVKGVVKVGGTKKLKMDRVEALTPDLIIAEKEENTQEMVEALEKHYPVYVADVLDLEGSLKMVRDLGLVTGEEEKGVLLANEVQRAYEEVRPLVQARRCMYFIWRKPWMVAGPGTFIDAMLQHCNLENVVSTERYPELNREEIIRLAPEVVLLSSEPYPFAEKHIAELREFLPEASFHLVDGEMFSWYGSCLRHAPEYLNPLLAALND